MSPTSNSATDDSQHADLPKFSNKLSKKPMSTKRFKKPMSTKPRFSSTKRLKKQMSTKRSERSLTDLPSNVLVEILARLPLRTLFVARSVCKTFRLLTTSNPHFISLHSSNAAQILVFHFGEFAFLRLPSYILRFSDKELHYKKSDLKSLFQLPKMDVEPHRTIFGSASCYFLVNSCNGLLLFKQDGSADFLSSVVCNPVTNEYVLIPEVDPRMELGSLTRSMWLGYAPAADQYKVLRLFSTGVLSDKVSAHVSVIGSDSWRHINGTPLQRPNFYQDTPGALVNLVMYWHHSSWLDLLSFDFEVEKFRGVALPPKFQREHYTSIGVLGGCLCLTYNDSSGHRVDLWVMTKCGSWIKEFVVDTRRPIYGHFRPLKFLQNGKVLMLLAEHKPVCYKPRSRLVCYNPGSKTLRCLWFNEWLKVDYVVLALTPSFVPLKDTLKVENVLSGLRPRGDEEEL